MRELRTSLSVLVCLGAICPCAIDGAEIAQPVELRQVISREHPDVQGTGTGLAIGRDGCVYLSGGRQNNGYVVRIARDGSQKFGMATTYAITGVGANSDGIVATANAHFAKSVNLYASNGQTIGQVPGFTGNDDVGWDGPGTIEVGSSGDFFALDQHAGRIVRISPEAKIVRSYPIPGVDEIAPHKLWRYGFRVCEAHGQIYFIVGSRIQCRGFDGALRWEVPSQVGGDPWGGFRGGFDVDDDGRLFLSDGISPLVRMFDADGQLAGEVTLQTGERHVTPQNHISHLRVFGDDMLVRQPSDTEMFQVYDRASGAFRRSVSIDFESLSVTYPSPVWTAGQRLPLTVQFERAAVSQSAGSKTESSPLLAAWLRPLGTVRFEPLAINDGHIQVPGDVSGLFHLRVGSGLGGSSSEYQVETVIEIRPENAVGSISLLTPLNRRSYARGEAIPYSVLPRTTDRQEIPPTCDVQLVDAAGAVRHRLQIALRQPDAAMLPTVLPSDVTRELAAGEYRLTTTLPGWTVADQYLHIGTAGAVPTEREFHRVRHGDYSMAFPQVDYFNAAERISRHLDVSLRLGNNLFVDRLGHGGGGGLHELPSTLKNAELIARLQADPIAVAPEKAEFENRIQQTVAAYGAAGIQQRAILLYMDAGLPVGTGFDQRPTADMQRDIRAVSDRLADYPAFGGWSWAANWWIAQRGAALAETPDEKSRYEAAYKAAQETGRWDPILETVSDRWINHAVEAERTFRQALAPTDETQSSSKLISAMTAPYRQPGIIPPLSFANADEVDLHWQAEQIQWPMVSAHNVDFYKRPGKPAWGHPELWNDDGTGGQILSSLLQLVMRGANGVGQSGSTKGFAAQPTDARAMGPGATSVHRRLNEWLADHGANLAATQANDPVVIPVSTRMLRLELGWQGVGGFYFTRLFEAYNACLRAHRPARFVFAEDCQPDSLQGSRAILLVSQTVELDPPLAVAIAAAWDSGSQVFIDATCRDGLFDRVEAQRLDTQFTRIEHDHHLLNDDSAFWRYRESILSAAAQLQIAWKDSVPPVAACPHPEVLLTERQSGDVRLLWAVNDAAVPLNPGQLWRVSLAAGSRWPVVTELQWPASADCDVFELFSGQPAEQGANGLRVDLRHAPARVFVAIPHAAASQTSESVPGTGDSTDWKSIVQPPQRSGSEPFAARLRDVVVSQDQRSALVTAAGWDTNAFLVDVADGSVRRREHFGHHFAYGPQPTQTGFAIQGYDLNSAEGYHLYLLGPQLERSRRFALYGLPKRGTSWAVARQVQEAINSFAVSPDGAWVASAGDLGLAVWSADGTKRWSDDWWRDGRQRRRLMAINSRTLLALNQDVATMYDAQDGRPLWSQAQGDTGEVTRAMASQDGRVVALVSTHRGGRIFVVRDLVPVNSLPTAADDASLSPDGRFIAVTLNDELRLFDTTGGLVWSIEADDVLRSPRFSPDSSRIVVGSEIGTLYVFSTAGERLCERDLGALPAADWLDDGGLLVADWLGSLQRLDAEFQPVWQTQLAADGEPAMLADDATPTVKMTDWGNTAEQVAPLTPNLLTETQALIEARCEPATHGDPREWQHDINLLRDGQPLAPEKPWLEWTDISYLDSGWRQKLVIEINTFRSQLRVDGITIVEDGRHPESWTRDMRLQWWDADAEAWRDGPYLLSNQAQHTHWFEQPLEAAKFRFVSTGGASWPVGNIRWGELVFHGKVLGPSHPDAVADRPVAVLFDEREADLKHLMTHGQHSFEFRYDDAFSGGKSAAMRTAGHTTAHWRPPFGHVLPNWDFQIVEQPSKPGEYRWLEFAWKAASPQTTGMSLRLGPHHGGGVAVSSGQATAFESAVALTHSAAVPSDWQTLRIDLWQTHGGPFSIRSMSLGAEGAGALFDRIRLARSAIDLDRASE